MLYPDNTKKALNWIYERYSDIVAGAVLNNMNKKHTTFAGYMAQAFMANAATFEQGTIGYTDWNTFTPQLFNNIKNKIRGEECLEEKLGFDVWQLSGNIIKKIKISFS